MFEKFIWINIQSNVIKSMKAVDFKISINEICFR